MDDLIFLRKRLLRKIISLIDEWVVCAGIIV